LVHGAAGATFAERQRIRAQKTLVDQGLRTKDGLKHQVLRTKDGSYTETKLL